MTCSIRCSRTMRSRSQRSEDREAGYVASVERLLVEEPDRSQPHLGMLDESFRNQSPDISRADDQRALAGLTFSPGPALGGEEPDSARDRKSVAKSQGR